MLEDERGLEVLRDLNPPVLRTSLARLLQVSRKMVAAGPGDSQNDEVAECNVLSRVKSFKLNWVGYNNSLFYGPEPV